MNDEVELFRRVERGEISAEEAARLLEELQEDYYYNREELTSDPSETIREQIPSDKNSDAEIKHFEWLTRWWLAPFILGVLVTILGAFWMYLGWNLGKPLFGFWLSWIPFVTGIILMALSWRAKASHWIHLRINQGFGRHPKNFTLRFPLPFNLVRWANRRFGHYFPSEVRGIDLDDLIDSIEESVTADNPIYLWVDDEKEMQQVEIWIGRGVE